MNRRTAFICTSISLAALALPAGNALAQKSNELVGTWTAVSAGDSYGDKPLGLLIFSADGHYQLSLQRPGLPKFAAKSRDKGTADENKAVIAGTINHYGKYTVDQKAKTFTFHILASSYPNWNGTVQQRPYTIKDGVLNYKVAAASSGNTPGEVTWRRAK